MDALQFKISNEITIVKIVVSFLKFISLSRQYLVNGVRFQKYHGQNFFLLNESSYGFMLQHGTVRVCLFAWYIVPKETQL